MRRTSLFALLLLITVSFGIAGGCSDSNNGNDQAQPTPSPTSTPTPGPTPSPTPGPTPAPTPAPTPGPTPGPGGSIIEEGGTLSLDAETFDYVGNDNERQMLDYYEITGLDSQAAALSTNGVMDGKRPAIIFIHGGAWILGSKEDVLDEQVVLDAAEMAGFHLVSVGYRLAQEDQWPAQAEDVNSAIRWIKQNSDALGINPEKLIIVGGSAGAHIGAAVAMGPDVDELQGSHNLEPPTGTDVSMAFLIFGAYDLNMIVGDGIDLITDGTCGAEVAPGILGVIALLDCGISFNILDPLDGCSQNALDSASPEFYVDSTDPPTYLAHGRDDCTVPYFQTVGMANALDGAGVTFMSTIIPGGEHNTNSLNLSVDDILGFIDDNLVP